MEFYNNHRLHQSLGYNTPKSVHFAEEKKKNEVIEIPMDMMDKSCDLPTGTTTTTKLYLKDINQENYISN